MSAADRPAIRLVQLSEAAMTALLAGDLDAASREAGVALTPYLLAHGWLWRIRLDQVRRQPADATWIARAVVAVPSGIVVGHAGFHGAPDAQGMVEVAYSVDPAHRRQGYATAMLRAALAWAAEDPAVKTVRASISPDNAASLATAAKLGFVRTGEQWDDEDGLELVFERPVLDVYTHGHHESVLRSHRWRTAENSAGYLLPHLDASVSLLDVGCGPGTLTMDLATRVTSVTALERSAEALELAREEAAARRATNLTFLVGDVQALDLPDDSFDVVHAHQVLQHLTDPVGALREMRRVCRPDGLLAVRDSDYGAFTWFPAVPALDDWLATYSAVARANGAEPDAGRRLLSWARAAGLRDIAATSSTWCFATPADRAWWGGLWAERIVSSTVADQALTRGLATAEDLDRIAAGWQEWAASDDGWISLLHGEVLGRP